MDSTKSIPLVEIQGANLVSEKGDKIWNSFSFRLESQSIHALIGQSGSGKSTFAYSLFGVIPQKCNLTYQIWNVLGNQFEEKRSAKHQMFLVPQNPNLAFHPYLSLESQMKSFYRFSLGRKYDPKELENLWESLGLLGVAQKSKETPHSLSGGEKQRILLSLALLADAQILVLDEPTTGLDSESESWVLNRIYEFSKKKDKAVIFVSHDLRIVESLASHITIMKEGHVEEFQTIKERSWIPSSDYGKILYEAYAFFQ
ncbi:ABC transporter, ATP-binding domain protein [Leptospira ryugenii]|uniref:ABC transporter, ATP-binding domain protein n=1 Tax=Leptospira ryugenii TaxID=1917863 RepID=A0A2P2DWK7_9LEPT|nr:ATP-binding cassette domain-containing protein [Leptospira ryugenii]GBF49018.1 ABC transporter, ATP-binding domain protein [Leptospira ryugenii]